jgi:hypothetical protein
MADFKGEIGIKGNEVVNDATLRLRAIGAGM